MTARDPDATWVDFGGESGDETAEMPAPTRIADRYAIEGLLGVGGMGSVYKARDLELNEVVALKMLRADMLAKPRALDRFRQEVRLARKVTHPGVVRTFDLGEHDGTRFLTMEYVEGQPLSALLDEQGALRVAQAMRLIDQICAAVGAAHDAGVLHRDLKPDNVLVTPDGRALITDFGIASGRAEVASGEIVGTPAYIAPEVVNGQTADVRADVFAIGLILFEMLTGRRARNSRSLELIRAGLLPLPVVNPTDHRPGLPQSLASVVVQATYTDPRMRFATVGRLAAAISGHATYSSGELPGRSAARRPAENARTVAVLPFRNAGPADNDFIAEGLTEEIIDTLSSTRGLRVRPLHAVTALGDAVADPVELGRRLGVQVVVEGSVRAFGDRLRCRSRLISVEDGFQLWARKIDCGIGEVLEASDQLAGLIAETLTAELTAQKAQGPLPTEAAELYLRGRAHLRANWNGDLLPSVESFEAALNIAPDDARLLAGYAVARSRMAFLLWADAPAALSAAREAAERAVAAAPHLGEPWLAKGSVHFNAMESREAVSALKHAVELAPGLSEAQRMLGLLLSEAGDLDAGLQHLEAALLLDPNATSTRVELCRVLTLRGETERARDIAIEGTQRWRIALWSGEPDVPLPGALPGISLPEQTAWAFQIVASTGTLPAPLLEMLAALPPPPPGRTRHMYHQFQAELFVATGNTGRAWQSLQQAVHEGLSDLAYIDHCPLFAEFRQRPAWPTMRALVAERAADTLAGLTTSNPA